MGKLTEILSLAQQRAQAMGLPYEGALTPREVFDLMRLAPGARLVDAVSYTHLTLPTNREV